MTDKTINDLATYANQHMKVNKSKAYDGFRSLFASLTQEQIENNWYSLGQMYLAFLPAKPATPKTLFDMAQKFTGKRDVRSYLNYVYIDADGRLNGCNGHILLRSKTKSDQPTGYYDQGHNKIDEPTKYPDVGRVIDPALNGLIVTEEDRVLDVEHNSKAPCYELTLAPSNAHPFTVRVQKTYLELAEKCFPNGYTMVARDRHSAIGMYDDEKDIVIMPVRKV